MVKTLYFIVASAVTIMSVSAAAITKSKAHGNPGLKSAWHSVLHYEEGSTLYGYVDPLGENYASDALEDEASVAEEI